MSFWKKEINLFGRRDKARGTVLVPMALYMPEPKPMPEAELESLYAEIEAQSEPEIVETEPDVAEQVIRVEVEPKAAGFAPPPELLDPPPFPVFAPRPALEPVIELVPEPVSEHEPASEPEPVAEPEPVFELVPDPVAQHEPVFEPAVLLPPAAAHQPMAVHQPEFGTPPAEPVWGRYEPTFAQAKQPEPEPEPRPYLQPDPQPAPAEPAPEPERRIAPWSGVDLDRVDEPDPFEAPAVELPAAETFEAEVHAIEAEHEPEREPESGSEPLHWADPAYAAPRAEYEPEPEPEPFLSPESQWEPTRQWQPEPALEPAPEPEPVQEPEPVSPWSSAAPTGAVFPIFGAPEPEAEAPQPDVVEQPRVVEGERAEISPTPGPFYPVTVEAAAPEPSPVAFVASAPETMSVAVPEAMPEPAPKTPLLKREIRLRRPKREAQPSKPKPAKEKKVRAEKAKAPKAEKPKRMKDTRPRQSVWERNLSLPRPRRRHAALKVVGLRVGSSQLAAAHVANNGSIELLQLARTPLRPGLVVGGEVREPDALAKEIKAFFSKSKLPSRNVRLGIASNRIGVRVLEVPAISDPKAFGNAIRFRAQEVLPIPVTDAVLDHVVLGEFEGEGGSTMNRVLVAFAHRDLVGRHAEACRKAGLKLAGVDLDAFALLRSIAEPRDEDADPTHAVVAVAVGHERTIFAVSDGRICDFVRVLEWGGGVLDEALARALGMPVELAHEAKHQLALSGEAAAPGGLTPVQVEAARAAVRSELRVLGQEIVSSLRYYQTRPGSLAIGEVLVTGGGSELPGLTDELEQIVGAPVRTGDPFSRVKVSKKVKRPVEAGSYAVAIGLGIEG